MKKFVLILAALCLNTVGWTGAVAQVAYTVTISTAGPQLDNPAFGTEVMLFFGNEDPVWVEVEDIGGNVGVATFVRQDWFGGNWSATIDASLIPLDPLDDWDQLQGGANPALEWTIEE